MRLELIIFYWATSNGQHIHFICNPIKFTTQISRLPIYCVDFFKLAVLLKLKGTQRFAHGGSRQASWPLGLQAPRSRPELAVSENIAVFVETLFVVLILAY